MPDICCWNEWTDYTGGPDHVTIEEARACEEEHRRDGVERPHVVIITLEEYEQLIDRNAPVVVSVDNEKVMEDIVIGVLTSMRSIDPTIMRARWRQHPDEPLPERVRSLLGHNGPEYHAVVNTLSRMGWQ